MGGRRRGARGGIDAAGHLHTQCHSSQGVVERWRGILQTTLKQVKAGQVDLNQGIAYGSNHLASLAMMKMYAAWTHALIAWAFLDSQGITNVPGIGEEHLNLLTAREDWWSNEEQTGNQ